MEQAQLIHEPANTSFMPEIENQLKRLERVLKRLLEIAALQKKSALISDNNFEDTIEIMQIRSHKILANKNSLSVSLVNDIFNLWEGLEKLPDNVKRLVGESSYDIFKTDKSKLGSLSEILTELSSIHESIFETMSARNFNEFNSSYKTYNPTSFVFAAASLICLTFSALNGNEAYKNISYNKSHPETSEVISKATLIKSKKDKTRLLLEGKPPVEKIMDGKKVMVYEFDKGADFAESNNMVLHKAESKDAGIGTIIVMAGLSLWLGGIGYVIQKESSLKIRSDSFRHAIRAARLEERDELDESVKADLSR